MRLVPNPSPDRREEAVASATRDRSILRLEDVSRTHGQGSGAVRTLGPVSLDIRAGEFVAIMGPSGSGKSTLLAIAGTLDEPTTGRVSIHGEEVARMTLSQRARLRRRVIGFVFQETNLIAGLTALENVALPLELDGVSASVAREEGMESLRRVDLTHLADRFPEDLSGGEQQRVAIARAVVGPRELLLADEPTGALDTVSAERVMRLLRSECDRGRTAVLVTHDASHAAWADRILFLRDGVWAEGVGGASVTSSSTGESRR